MILFSLIEFGRLSVRMDLIFAQIHLIFYCFIKIFQEYLFSKSGKLFAASRNNFQINKIITILYYKSKI